jgi:hypothetical protein
MPDETALMVALPDPIADTNPALETVATPGFDVVHVKDAARVLP